jgi:hypothetical protein
MESPNLGPEWVWRLFAALIFVGSFSIIFIVVKGIIWAVNHVHIE